MWGLSVDSLSGRNNMRALVIASVIVLDLIGLTVVMVLPTFMD
jgi:hypothetical protein